MPGTARCSRGLLARRTLSLYLPLEPEAGMLYHSYETSRRAAEPLLASYALLARGLDAAPAGLARWAPVRSLNAFCRVIGHARPTRLVTRVPAATQVPAEFYLETVDRSFKEHLSSASSSRRRSTTPRRPHAAPSSPRSS